MTLKFTLNTLPGYIVLDDLLTPELIDQIKDLVTTIDLMDPEYTGSARTKDGEPLKQNSGSFTRNELLKNIHYYIFRSLGHDDVIEDLKPTPYFYSMFKRRGGNTSQACASQLSHLISLYNEGDRYEPHSDFSDLTALYWLKEDGADFTGGDLLLPEYDEKIDFKPNRMVIFQGNLLHQVNPVSGRGRICVSTFVGQAPRDRNEDPSTPYEPIRTEEWLTEDTTSEKLL